MRNHHKSAVPSALIVLLSALGMPCVTLAEDSPPVPAPAASASSQREKEADKPLAARPLAARQLGGQRGGSDVFSDMSLRGVVADNRAINAITGSNLVSQGALAGMSGVPMLVQNTGNNVLIQNATIINVQLK